MPLPASKVERELIHIRQIECKGYERSDGLTDIDGWLTDIKTYNFPNSDRNEIKAGEPLHGMGVRITVDNALNIIDCIAITDHSPFKLCGNITPNFKALVGLTITHGFTRKTQERLGGTKGCTHLVELMRSIATTAFQTLARKQSWADTGSDTKEEDDSKKSPLIDSCHAWARTGDAVKKRFPNFYIDK
tara:strand:+ start:419 stop:985 length:567 start_codon:yes stop_codon:yes gene_type:complete